MRIAVFGTKGFLGSKFLEKFENAIGINNLEDLELKTINGLDLIINCAGASNVSYSFENPNLDFLKNTLLVQQLLEKIRLSSNNHIKYINLSSAAVYGNPNTLPVGENSLVKPISPYGFHKKMAENICFQYSQCFDLKTISLRIFSAYGLGQKKMLLWDLHQQILSSSGPISLYGTGEESRDYIHTDDIFHQMMLAVNHADFKGEAINIGNGEEVKVKQIVELYQKHHPKHFEFYFNGDNRPGDPLNWCADISKMREWGFMQKVQIDEGVKEYIKWLYED